MCPAGGSIKKERAGVDAAVCVGAEQQYYTAVCIDRWLGRWRLRLSWCTSAEAGLLKAGSGRRATVWKVEAEVALVCLG